MIYFVGAGSGAADLITVRGMKLLQEAEVIVYAGSLVNPQLLAYAAPDCEIYDSARLHLQQVMDIMIPAARAGKKVVRLHTGDPSIYGAIREQMDRLEEAEIPYEVCPGVSSFCGAAAALKKEYTLPGVSQTLILTRMEGRTPVPEGEKIRSLAAHGSSMAIFLSASMLPGLQQELLAGGAYTPDTPCAIVYKATWPEEKTIETTLSQLAEAAASEGITKTALILVGDFLGNSYELSKLYDPSFSTEFRQGISGGDGCKTAENRAAGPAEKECRGISGRRVLRTAILCYTDRGLGTARKIARAMQELPGIFADTGIFRFRREDPEAEPVEAPFEAGAFFGENTAEAFPGAGQGDAGVYFFSDTQKLMSEQFHNREALIFVGAAGIAVRETAPWIRHKALDPAVLAADEGGRNIIPLLSGHLGGANELAEKLAARTGARAVVTTASEGRGIPAVDLFAQENGLRILDMKAARRAAAWLLKTPGGKPEYREDGPERGRICAGETEV
ncbi:MAG: precorrin-4 C(11)-methyltransferase, partial [Anaerovoracaceae bacterium]